MATAAPLTEKTFQDRKIIKVYVWESGYGDYHVLGLTETDERLRLRSYKQHRAAVNYARKARELIYDYASKFAAFDTNSIRGYARHITSEMAAGKTAAEIAEAMNFTPRAMTALVDEIARRLNPPPAAEPKPVHTVKIDIIAAGTMTTEQMELF